MSGPLRIFPAYGLDNSLLTAVLVGLYIRFLFTEWLGWVFSGLVVPGYLAAIILLRPASAIMIIGEAVVTLVVVRGLSSLMSLTKLGTPMFGRDRFVWLVVVGVGVRVVFESILAPWLEARLRARYGWDPADSFGLYGIGLVLVPLLANACWKPGLWRGSFQQVVCIGATYFFLRALLVTTNLSFASVAVSFDQIALQQTASPKAYLLLMVGVLLASRANLRFGWDTSGVLIPGLLGLSFFVPSKVLATVGESLLIALAASIFVRLPKVRDWNLEGPRRVVMLFTIGYAIKSFLIAAFGAAIPSFTTTEIFGIGYLLPSLLALKIWQRKNPAMVLLPALSLSIAGFGLGSLFGYELVEPSLLAQRLTATLQHFGVRSVMRTQYDPDTLDPPSHLVSLLRLRTAGGFVTLRVGPELRERFRPEPLSSAQRLLFTRLEVPAVRVKLEELLLATCTAPLPGAIPKDLVKDARTFATTLHPALIDQLSARVKAQHLRLRVVDDERLAEAYLLIDGAGGAAAITLRPQKTTAIDLVCNRNLAAQIRHAQSVGAESIEVRVP